VSASLGRTETLKLLLLCAVVIASHIDLSLAGRNQVAFDTRHSLIPSAVSLLLSIDNPF